MQSSNDKKEKILIIKNQNLILRNIYHILVLDLCLIHMNLILYVWTKSLRLDIKNIPNYFETLSLLLSLLILKKKGK